MGPQGKPCPTPLPLSLIEIVRSDGAEATVLIKDTYQAIKEVYGPFLGMILTSNQAALNAMFEHENSVPHEAFITPYRGFLGHLCSLWALARLTTTGLCVSKVAKSYYCPAVTYK